jgi:hypothetical protein
MLQYLPGRLPVWMILINLALTLLKYILVKGKGTHPLTEIYFSSVKAKFIKIIQTGRRPGKYWSIHDLQIYGK